MIGDLCTRFSFVLKNLSSPKSNPIYIMDEIGVVGT